MEWERIGIKEKLYGFKLGGEIKKKLGDFIVEEVGEKVYTVNYNLFQKLMDFLPKKRKKYLHFTLVKKNYTTDRAVKIIARSLGISKRRFGWAGTKDKFAITSQRISIREGDHKKLRKLRIKGLMFKEFEYKDKPLRLGDLKGNLFTIRIWEIKGDVNIFYNIEKIPNFFGPQRFGKRLINHVIGREILKNNLEEACKLFLTYSFNERGEIREARSYLEKNWGNFKEALKFFPKDLDLELAMLNYLVKNPNDWEGALKTIPYHILKMFIHSYQSYVFNLALSNYIKQKNFIERIPLFGKSIKLDKETEKVLEEEEINPKEINLKKFGINLVGKYRKAFVEVKNKKILEIGMNPVIKFFLEKGSYATILLREIME